MPARPNKGCNDAVEPLAENEGPHSIRFRRCRSGASTGFRNRTILVVMDRGSRLIGEALVLYPNNNKSIP